MVTRRFLLFITVHILVSEIHAASDLLKDRSVACSSKSMDVSLSFSQPFSGGVFTEKGFSSPRCRWKGKGSQQMSVSIPINATDCGVTGSEKSGEFSVKLIVSPVDGILVDGFSAISVRCIYETQDITLTLPPGPDGHSIRITSVNHSPGLSNSGSEVRGSGGAPVVSMAVLDGHGIDGPPISRAAVGQRVTLDLVLKNTAIYDFYVHSCYAHDGSNTPDASINVIDHNGCGVRLSRAIDVPVMSTQPINNGPKHIYIHMYGFQFTSSQFVHFECQVKPCIHSCQREQCEESGKVPLIPALRKRREENHLNTLKLQTVLEIEPQQAQPSALVSSNTSSSCISWEVLVGSSILCGLFVLVIVAIVIAISHSTKRSCDSVYSQ